MLYIFQLCLYLAKFMLCQRICDYLIFQKSKHCFFLQSNRSSNQILLILLNCFSPRYALQIQFVSGLLGERSFKSVGIFLLKFYRKCEQNKEQKSKASIYLPSLKIFSGFHFFRVCRIKKGVKILLKPYPIKMSLSLFFITKHKKQIRNKYEYS